MLERLPSRKATQFVPCGRSDTQKKPLVFAAEDMLVIVIIIVILFVCSKKSFLMITQRMKRENLDSASKTLIFGPVILVDTKYVQF